jgi:hypothetical protein
MRRMAERWQCQFTCFKLAHQGSDLFLTSEHHLAFPFRQKEKPPASGVRSRAVLKK